jgi:hypothetical protein
MTKKTKINLIALALTPAVWYVSGFKIEDLLKFKLLEASNIQPPKIDTTQNIKPINKTK